MGYDVISKVGLGHQIADDKKETFWAIINELIPGVDFEYDDGPFFRKEDGEIEWIHNIPILTFELPNGKSIPLEYYTSDDEHIADSDASFFGIRCDGFSLPQLMELDLISQSPQYELYQKLVVELFGEFVPPTLQAYGVNTD